MATHSSILGWRIPWTEEPTGYSLWGHKESNTTERLTLSFTMNLKFGRDLAPHSDELHLFFKCI